MYNFLRIIIPIIVTVLLYAPAASNCKMAILCRDFTANDPLNHYPPLQNFTNCLGNAQYRYIMVWTFVYERDVSGER